MTIQTNQATTSRNNLLLAAAITTMALPIILMLVEKLSGERAILDSISAYYHSGSRDIFVGFLFAISAILFVYEGRSKKENIALNLAGFCGVIVALVPTSPPVSSCGFACNNLSPYCIHTIAALAFFFCLAYVSFFCFCSEHGSEQPHEHDVIDKKYEKTFRVIAGLLLLFPALSAIFSTGLFSTETQCSNFLFWAEFAAIYTLGFMWITRYRQAKERDLDNSKAIS